MYQSFQEIIRIEKSFGLSFWEVIRENDTREMDITAEEALRRMEKMYDAMREADKAYDPSLSSASGLAGCDGERIAAARREGTRFIPGACDGKSCQDGRVKRLYEAYCGGAYSGFLRGGSCGFPVIGGGKRIC